MKPQTFNQTLLTDKLMPFYRRLKTIRDGLRTDAMVSKFSLDTYNKTIEELNSLTDENFHEFRMNSYQNDQYLEPDSLGSLEGVGVQAIYIPDALDKVELLLEHLGSTYHLSTESIKNHVAMSTIQILNNNIIDSKNTNTTSFTAELKVELVNNINLLKDVLGDIEKMSNADKKDPDKIWNTLEKFGKVLTQGIPILNKVKDLL